MKQKKKQGFEMMSEHRKKIGRARGLRRRLILNKSVLKAIVVLVAVILAVAVYGYPFPGPCYDCSIFQGLSSFLFDILGLTAFCLPLLILLALFFSRKERVRKFLKFSLLLWLPVLLNLALVRDLFELETRIGGIAGKIFLYAHDNKIDFLFLFTPILALDLFILHLLGVDIPGLFQRLFNELKGFFVSKDEEEAEEDTEKPTNDQ